ncbi:MAG: phosphoadenylyl-sulfate reductase [Alphaproteobacteria bacterium]|nr:phosphoadenylyl-sulfate reductase [Alphaproteobacteria bacterium]
MAQAKVADFAATLEQHATLMQLAYGGLDGADLLRAALSSELAGATALVSSFGADSGVLLRMVAEVAPATPVIFLDTGMHFGQTRGYGAALAKELGLTDVRIQTPDQGDLAQGDPNDTLWQRDTGACCHLRKVLPLARALEGFDSWITGRRRHQLGERVDMPAIEADATHIKLNPLAGWSQADIDAYYAAHAIERHPLYEQGYPSIGCWPCTKSVETGGDARAGRWKGDDKTECGIHMPGFDPSI